MKFNFFKSKFAKKSKFHWDFMRYIEEIKNWEELSENYDSYKKAKSLNKNIVNTIPKIIHQI